ncbi:MAG: OB-fold nucleic acid binding domain-containing protein, partial [Thermotogota bacterium]|nr:OB-fold nucleic acid binding domain-containing protein [Thermotogota bacterium]
MWVYIEDFKNHIGETVTLKGWVFNKRSSGKIHFLQLRDGTGTTQGILEKVKVEESVFEKAKELRIESS